MIDWLLNALMNKLINANPDVLKLKDEKLSKEWLTLRLKWLGLYYYAA